MAHSQMYRMTDKTCRVISCALKKVASVFFRYSVMISATFPQLTRLKAAAVCPHPWPLFCLHKGMLGTVQGLPTDTQSVRQVPTRTQETSRDIQLQKAPLEWNREVAECFLFNFFKRQILRVDDFVAAPTSVILYRYLSSFYWWQGVMTCPIWARTVPPQQEDL